MNIPLHPGFSSSSSALPISSTQSTSASFNEQTADRFVRTDAEVNQLALSLFTDSPKGTYQTHLHQSLLEEGHSPHFSSKPHPTAKAQPAKISDFRILQATNFSPSGNLLSLSTNYTLAALDDIVYLIENPIKKASKEATKVVSEWKNNLPISLVTFIPEGQDYATFDNGAVLRITNIKTSAPLQVSDLSRYLQRVCCAAWRDPNELAFGTNNGVFLLDRRERPSFKQLQKSSSADITSLDFSRERTYLSAGDDSGLVSIFDIRSMRYPVSKYTHTTAVKTLGWLPQNRYLLSGNYEEEGTLKVFDISQEKIVLEVPNPGITELKLHGDHLFSAHRNEDTHIKMWSFDVKRGLRFTENLSLSPGTTGYFTSLVVENDSTGLLMGAANFSPTLNPCLHLWKLETETRRADSVADEFDSPSIR